MITYLDTSALLKLARVEAESAALHEWLVHREATLATSVVARVELIRAAGRIGPRTRENARGLLPHLTVLPLTEHIATIASLLAPPALRSLDAIHVATALSLRPDCDVVVTYDHRMAASAVASGLLATSPGAETAEGGPGIPEPPSA